MKAIGFSILLLAQSLCAADTIYNDAGAVRSLLGIDIMEQRGFKQPHDEHLLVIKSLSSVQAPSVAWTIRDPHFRVVARVTTDAIMLKTAFLSCSFLEHQGAIVPLRLFFNPDGSTTMPIPKNSKIPGNEKFFTQGWRIPPDLLSADALKSEPTNSGTKKTERQTAEEVLRSWGIFLPEGTVFYYGLPTSGIMVRSTEKCLREIESKFREHGIKPVPLDG
jgi:hypothetical protein